MTPLLTVSNLSRDFTKSLDMVAKLLNRLGQNYREEVVHAVDDVSFSVLLDSFVGLSSSCLMLVFLSLCTVILDLSGRTA